jgi:hypothetical protein
VEQELPQEKASNTTSSSNGGVSSLTVPMAADNESAALFMKDGIYKVTFDGPEVGSGIVVVRGTKFTGGDGYFYYSGVFSQHVGEMKATFEVKRHTPGTASVFGRDSLTATLTGKAGKEEFFLEAPRKTFTVTGKRLETSIFDDQEKATDIVARDDTITIS